MAAEGPTRGGSHIEVELDADLEGNVRGFNLTLGSETVHLEANKSWVHTDHHKWVTRGLIEEPQSFHVHKDGTVEINGEKIRPDDPEGVAKLDLQINKHHEAPGLKPAAFVPAARSPAANLPAGNAGRVQFRVRLDSLGHVLVEAHAGKDKIATGLKGLHTLVQNGLLLPPGQFHLDPLQTYVELDGTRYDCNPEGVKKLEETLNARYAPAVRDPRGAAIEIKENPASPTGFDIHFVTVRAGARFDVKAHLTQAELDILQDPNKSDLLVRGTILKFSSPLLLVRRKRPDGGEERIPEIPDLYYLRSTARQMQDLFNHPLLRGARTDPLVELEPGDLTALRVTRQSGGDDRPWLEGETVPHAHFESRALTHHNITDLQQRGCFKPHLTVTCSIDHSVLSVLDNGSSSEERIQIGPTASEAELQAAGLMLTGALQPSRPRPEPNAGSIAAESPVASAAPRVNSSPAPAAPASPPAPKPKPVEPPPPPQATTPLPAVAAFAAPELPTDRAVVSLFENNDPWRINEEIFRSLVNVTGLPVQDLLLSLPRVFEDRRFEVLPLEEQEIGSVLDLRGPDFYGFYLVHIGTERIDFVYACRGVHIEWGTDKCVLQTSLESEAIELRQSGLLGLAQAADNRFVFVVTEAYRAWIRPHELAAAPAMVRFVTVMEIAAEPELYTFIWPSREEGDSSA